MKRSNGAFLGLYTLGIAVLFLVGCLALVVFGAVTYRTAAEGQARNNEARALLSYLSNCVKGGDSAGSISVRDEGQGPILMIADGSGYALRIYQSDGLLLEEYSAAEAGIDPKNAAVLGQTTVFTVELPDESTMRITTDAGSVLLHVRSGAIEG